MTFETSPWRQNQCGGGLSVSLGQLRSSSGLLSSKGGTMRTGRTLSALFVVAFMVSAGAASPTAAQQQGTRCVAELSMVLSPGLSEKAGTGAFPSGGETGTITGADGRKGTSGTDGRYGTTTPSTCSSGGEGWGVSSFTIKNANVKNTYTIT